MPYDPNFPTANTKATAAAMRAQLNGLYELIVPGPPGPQGEPGPAFATIIIDAVITLAAGEAAYVTATLVGNEVHLVIGLPMGATGAQGIQGPPFANVIIDSVTTLPPGSMATVTASFDGTNVHLNIGIPAGANGADGAPGIQGPQGIQGPPGEVTAAQLSTAIAGTSNNTNGVALLGLTVSDPPTQAEVQAVANKLDELILAQRR